MNYIYIYNRLATVDIDSNTQLSAWQRLMLTFRIAKCSPTIKEEIFNYLDTQRQPEYSLTLTFKDRRTGETKTTEVSCHDVQNKMQMQPLPALLYMDWLRREPEQASVFVVHKDNILTVPTELIRAHVDPELLAKADKARKVCEQRLTERIESGE